MNMTKARVDAMIAGSYNQHFGGQGDAMTPRKAASLKRQDRVALLHALSVKGCSLYKPAEVASVFAAAVSQRDVRGLNIMQRYIIETKQIDGGVWLGPWKNGDCTARSKTAALAAMQVQHAKHHCPKRVLDTKTGEVLATVGDDEVWAEYAARCTTIREKLMAAEQTPRMEEAQVAAVYTAMCAANNIGATVDVSLVQPARNGFLRCFECDGGGEIVVTFRFDDRDHTVRYDNQDEFAKAYSIVL